MALTGLSGKSKILILPFQQIDYPFGFIKRNNIINFSMEGPYRDIILMVNVFQDVIRFICESADGCDSSKYIRIFCCQKPGAFATQA